MTDDVSPQSDESVKTDISSTSSSPQEIPPGMLPLVSPVFGKWAFWITAVPFLIYLGGTSFGAYLENVRKTGPAHMMRGYTRVHAKRLRLTIEQLPAEESARLLERLDPATVEKAMDDENSDFTSLIQQCDKLLSDDLVGIPPIVDQHAKTAKAFVQHFFELEALIEEHDLDDILDKHEAFILKQNLPAAEVPKLKTSWYPTCYTVACIAAFIAVLIASRGYLKIPFRISPLAIGVGVVGIFVWLGLWWLDKNVLGIGDFFAPNARAGFNPWRELKANPAWMYSFVGIRLLGLCLVIPVAEEFFARGFLMRYIEDIDWDQIPMGEATWKSLAGIIVYGAMTHPGEIVPAIAWFALITWMYLKGKNVWDCVVAHAVTNALLAAFVLKTNTWELW